jgi:hypothetical protein
MIDKEKYYSKHIVTKETRIYYEGEPDHISVVEDNVYENLINITQRGYDGKTEGTITVDKNGELALLIDELVKIRNQHERKDS